MGVFQALRLLYDHVEGVVQRLFSTFANGWPGLGLLLQRILTAILLVRLGLFESMDASFSTSMIPQLIASFAGMLLLAGLWTPVIGTLIAIIEIWVTLTKPGDPWISIVTATLGATAAMIGPGAWSLDARIFGRKHVAI